MNSQITRRSSSTALFLSAGLAFSAWGQASQPDTSKPQYSKPHTNQPATSPADRPVRAQNRVDWDNAPPLFLKADDAIGEDVADHDGEVIASVKDFIVDRGSGRIEYAVLSTGSVMGLGGKDIALPFAALRYDTVKDRFIVSMTAEQFERVASFSPKDWSSLEHTTWTEDLENWWDETFDDDGTDEDVAWRDPYTDAIRTADVAKTSPTTIEGTVIGVERKHVSSGEHACVEVKDSSGNIRHVVLGPSWYVMGNKAAPMRGDTIKAEAIRYTGDGDEDTYVALQATIEGERIELRDKDGTARWYAPSHDESRTTRRDQTGDKNRDTSMARRWGTSQLMYLSKLDDAPAHASDESGGEIQDIVLEQHSGQIAFIGFDPNENVLGIADEIVVVPWQLVSVGSDHEARIDGTKDMLVASEEMPDDLETLREYNAVAAIYGAYGIDVPEFRPRERGRDLSASQWNADGELAKAFNAGKDCTVQGRIIEVRDETLISGEPDAIVVVVDTDSGQRRVVLGPSWYVTRQNFECKPGDTIHVTGKTATLNGVEHVGARSIKSGDRTIVLWTGSSAAWEDN